MEFIFEYGMFLAKTVTLVIAMLIVIMAIVVAGMRGRKSSSGHIEVLHVNEQFKAMESVLRETVLSDDEHKAYEKERKQREKSERKAAKKKAGIKKAAVSEAVEPASGDDPAGNKEVDPTSGRLYIVDFVGDMAASAVVNLREEISAILTLAGEQDEILVRLESPGGMVHAYGLASSQLLRIVHRKIALTISVDKVAASGGYLMACMANRIIAAPFAVLGSIGVVAQIPNVYRLLKKNDIDVDIMTAGEYKRTMTVMGENTEKGKQKFQEELEDVHSLFKEFVATHRPVVDIDAVATGEAWYGTRALELHLVDQLMTSDEYIVNQCSSREVFRVTYLEDKSKVDRLMERISTGTVNLAGRIIEELTRDRNYTR